MSPSRPPHNPLAFPIDPALASRFGLDASDLLPPVLGESGDAAMDRQLRVHPLDAPRVEAAAMAQALRFFERAPSVEAVDLILWSWRLFPSSEDNLSEDPERFCVFEPLISIPREKLLFWRPRAQPQPAPQPLSGERALAPIRMPGAFDALKLPSARPDGSAGPELTLALFSDIGREELGAWRHPWCARHLLAAGWGSRCHFQSVSSGWSCGRFRLPLSDPLASLRSLYPAGASLLEALAIARATSPAAAGPRPSL